MIKERKCDRGTNLMEFYTKKIFFIIKLKLELRIIFRQELHHNIFFPYFSIQILKLNSILQNLFFFYVCIPLNKITIKQQ